MCNYEDSNYYMGKEKKLSRGDCSYLALAKNIIKLDKSIMEEIASINETDIEVVAKEFAVKFYRKDGGYISQIRNYLNIDLDLVAEDNQDFQCEKYKILYMFYVLKEKYSDIRIIELLGKQSMENIDSTAIGWKTYNGKIIHDVKSMLEKELSEKFIENIYNFLGHITNGWDKFYYDFNEEVDTYSSFGEKYDFDALISYLKTEPNEIIEKNNTKFVDFSPIQMLYLRILQNEQIGQIKDTIMVNSIKIESNYNVPPEMIEEMKALHKVKVDISEIEKYIETNINRIAKYVYLKRDIRQAEYRRIRYNKNKVPIIYDFCVRARPLTNMQEISTELFVISCLQAILLDDKGETFDYVFQGYQNHKKHKPQVQIALKRSEEVVDALKIYWVRKVMDHWHANLGRYDDCCKKREVQNLCDDMLIRILSCADISEMYRLKQLYYSRINKSLYILV